MGSEFWKGLLEWFKNTLVAYKTLSEADLDLMVMIDDTDKILEEIFTFYETREIGPSDEERQKMMYL